ncbi:MAG: ATP-binding cassette domain-containing protein [Chitinivibrionales bacterium]|nr:ATP-binding cassette domain-containing protein [Chitinivibrionales bacterium]
MIEVWEASKKFPGGNLAVRDISFVMPKGELLVLVGLSGCGKTTTLKMINRLVEADSGKIRIDGINIKEWDPIELRRNIGYAIQETGLLPHLTVAKNVGLVPRLKKWPEEKINEIVTTMMSMVRLEPKEFAHRYPHELSGGQRQRVGVARALAAEPRIMLMDEPFGALDPVTREELQDEFIALQQKLKKTIIFVTHDIFEAVKLGDRIAIMNNGCIEQLSYPESILKNPATPFVKKLIGRHREYLLQCAHASNAHKDQYEPA